MDADGSVTFLTRSKSLFKKVIREYPNIQENQYSKLDYEPEIEGYMITGLYRPNLEIILVNARVEYIAFNDYWRRQFTPGRGIDEEFSLAA